MKSTGLLICLAVGVACLPLAGSKSDEQGTDTPPPKPDASDKFIGKEAGQVRDDNGLKMKLVWCPPGSLTMEEVEIVEEPVIREDEEDEAAPKTRRVKNITPVKVLLTRGYWLGKYEVTQSEWKLVMETEPWKGRGYTKEGPDFPATWVSWSDATDFCRALTEQERQAGRLPNDWEYVLPTEAQWERACRARTETKYSFGDDESKLGDYAWFTDNAWKSSEQYAHQVGQKKPNPWGIFDMHGNVWEWCRDVYAKNLPGGRDPEVKPDEIAGSLNRDPRVNRGGAWDGSSANHCRSAFRRRERPAHRGNRVGFRVALGAVR